MNLSLSYRIASKEIMLPAQEMCFSPYDEEAMRGRLGAESQLIAKIPQFRFDNVAEFYAKHDRQVWQMCVDIPNWAPPFSVFFAEWNEPKNWNMGHKKHNPKVGHSQVGYMVVSATVNDENRFDFDNWNLYFSAVVGYRGKLANPEVWQKHMGNTKWVLCCNPWLAVSVHPLCGKAQWLGYSHLLFVSAEGRLLECVTAGLTINRIFEKFSSDTVYSPLHILGLGISFCHCKNVVRKEETDDRGERWHRRSGVSKVKFYTLNINPMKETLRTQGGSEEVGLIKAMHICRGHFATYTPDNPLFGKYIGTFWRPDHVRGSKGSGEVHKRYDITP